MGRSLRCNSGGAPRRNSSSRRASCRISRDTGPVSLQALTRAGIVESTTGRNGGYRLGRSASEITLLDIVQAIEGKEPLFRCTEIRRRGPSKVAARSYSPTCGIAAAMWRAEQAWKEELQATTIAAVADLTMKQAPRAALEKGVTWITQVLAARNAVAAR